MLLKHQHVNDTTRMQCIKLCFCCSAKALRFYTIFETCGQCNPRTFHPSAQSLQDHCTWINGKQCKFKRFVTTQSWKGTRGKLRLRNLRILRWRPHKMQCPRMNCPCGYWKRTKRLPVGNTSCKVQLRHKSARPATCSSQEYRRYFGKSLWISKSETIAYDTSDTILNNKLK